ncbi:MAG: YggT family protein [Betaproteobacteria bacterium]|nr:YggT family protein [Betaproteobacteria bacterium]MDE1982558.1 YggT family protein [Betaproteobacteria bacterium]MDE2131603.1 YggT family protein [Betaproteobacteria bacterium]MDE2212903.1 YggT family protein [Betaproteobacteria bacterium]MDE2624105.1 YggT family protein [Betaproteobacteria bacterium]
MTGTLESLLEILFGLFSFAALLRFLLQLVDAPYRNPVSDFAISLSDFAVRRLQRVMPGRLGIAYAALLWAWVLECVLLTLNLTLFGMIRFSELMYFLPWVFAMGAVSLLRHGLYILMGAVFVLAVLSWVNPYSPVMPAADALTRPFLNPLRRFIPMLGSVDLSPVVLMVIFQLTLTIIVGGLEMLVQRLM